MELRGVFPVLPTPFSADGGVDSGSMARIVEFVLACGAHGVVFPGVASEFDFLSPKERQSLLTIVGECVGGRVPLVVGASATTVDEAADYVEMGASVGAAAAMVMAPANLGDDASSVADFFEEVAAKSSLPLMLQNAPPPVGAGLSVDTTLSVARSVRRIRYVKEETPPTGQRLSRLREGAQTDLVGVFGGAGARYAVDELNRGALGLMPAAELTDIHVGLFESHHAGAHERARELYARSLPLLLIQAIFRMRLTKEVLVRRGIIPSAGVRAPLPDFDDQDLREIDTCLRDLSDVLASQPASQVLAVG